MDEIGFQTYLKRQKKPQGTIDQYIRLAKEFNSYLLKKEKRNLDDAIPEDLNYYYNQLKEELKQPVVNRYLWSLLTYYRYKEADLLYCVVNDILGQSYLEKYKLRDFDGIEQEVIKKLSSNGVKTARQLLDCGKSQKERELIANKCNVPNKTILELVKLSDLVRIV